MPLASPLSYKTAHSICSPIGYENSDLLRYSSSAFYLASQYNSDYDCLPNLSNLTGDAVFGANLYSDRARVYGGVAYCVGSGANYFATPDTANNSPTNQFEVIMRVAAADWTPTVAGTLLSKYGAAGQRSFSCWLNTSGTLSITISNNGTATTIYSSTVANTFTNGQFYWLKFTFLSSGGNAINFYWAEDTGSNTQPSSWTQLGTQVTGSALTIFDSSANLQVCGTNNAADLAFNTSYMSFSKTIGGAALQVFDPSAVPNYSYGWRSSTGEDWTTNVSTAYQLDWQYKVEPAQLGSAGFYTNARIWGGRGYFPASASGTGNYFSAARTAAMDTITGDMDLKWEMAIPDWSPASDRMLGRWGNTGGSTQLWLVTLNGSGVFTLYWYTAAGVLVNKSSTANMASFAAGTKLHCRIVLDADNGAGGFDVKFYYGFDGVTWIQLGSTVTTAGSTNIRTNTNNVLSVGVGTDNVTSSGMLDGSVGYVKISNVIDGAPIVNLDFSTVTDLATSWTASTGEVWSVVKSTAADTNDPTRLVFNGEKYVYLPGVAGNYISTPSTTENSITGNIEFIARIKFGTYGGGLTQSIIAKNAAGTNRSYQFFVATGGNLAIDLSSDGSNSNTTGSTVNIPYSGGTAFWARATWNQSTKDMNFYVADDQPSIPTSWTQLGSTRNTATTQISGIYAGNAVLEIGTRVNGGTNFSIGNIYYASVSDTIDGSPVAKFDASLSEQTGYTDSINSTVWTINRATSGFKTALVTQTMLLTGSDDQLPTAHHPLLNRNTGQDFTVMGMFRQFATATNFGRLIEKVTSNANNGYQLLNNGTTLQNYVGYDGAGTTSANVTSATYSSGDLISNGLVIDGTLLYAVEPTSVRSASTATAGDGMTTTSDLFVSASTGRVQVEYYGHAIFRKALTNNELAKLRRELAR